MSGSWKPEDLPKLTSTNCKITSPKKKRYNCIAWAAGCETKWWWPEKYGYWPESAPREATLGAFVAAFATLGYEECEEGFLETEYEKVVLFAVDDSGSMKPTHAARQLPNGWWASKLGPLEDVEHTKPEDVEGPVYGKTVQFMRRPK